ncbi:MAG: nucleoside triphosphate pyrophosphohydrolase [Candidatus Marinimicrobia bacterium]|nr:nucleoside triphosphate pyrophosphohydrolase [Candidatus Neomarinimicrobiota bacterium]
MSEAELAEKFIELVKVVKKLRSPEGCQWDRAQTHQSLIPYMTEELYEVIEAIEENNDEMLKEELGDLLLHIIFQADLSEEERKFTLADSIDLIREKLIRRHPHVFAGLKVNSVSEIKKNWEKIKLKEGRGSLLDGIPMNLPALLLAKRVQQRASEVRFDWDKIDDVISKVREELNELEEAIKKKDHKMIKEELGDLLFSIVNLSRFLKQNPEEALRLTIKKFVSRFKIIEKKLREKGKKLEEATLSEMDKIWNELKEKEKDKIN